MPILPTVSPVTSTAPQTASRPPSERHSVVQPCAATVSSIGNTSPRGNRTAAVPPPAQRAFQDLVQYLREHGPERLGLSDRDVIALHDAAPDLADGITKPAAVLRDVMQARSLTDVMACLGQPANQQTAASGIHTLPKAWQHRMVHQLCETLVSHPRPASNLEALCISPPEYLAHRFAHLTGTADHMNPMAQALHSLPISLQQPLTKALIARADAWARTFALTSSQTHPAHYEAALRHVRLALTKPCLALVDRLPHVERDPLLSAMHLMLINNQFPEQDGCTLNDTSWDTFASLLARKAVDDATIRASILNTYGPFTMHQRACLLKQVTLLGLPRRESLTVELAPYFGATMNEATRAMADAMLLYIFGHALD